MPDLKEACAAAAAAAWQHAIGLVYVSNDEARQSRGAQGRRAHVIRGGHRRSWARRKKKKTSANSSGSAVDDEVLHVQPTIS